MKLLQWFTASMFSLSQLGLGAYIKTAVFVCLYAITLITPLWHVIIIWIMMIFFKRTRRKKIPWRGLINFQARLTNSKAWMKQGEELWMIDTWPDQSRYRSFKKRATSQAIINLSASISTPETFLNTKAKCPLDGRRQCSSWSAGIWSKKIAVFRHREAAQHWLQTRRTIKSQIRSTSTSISVANYLDSVWWIIECN